MNGATKCFHLVDDTATKTPNLEPLYLFTRRSIFGVTVQIASEIYPIATPVGCKAKDASLLT